MATNDGSGGAGGPKKPQPAPGATPPPRGRPPARSAHDDEPTQIILRPEPAPRTAPRGAAAPTPNAGPMLKPPAARPAQGLTPPPARVAPGARAPLPPPPSGDRAERTIVMTEAPVRRPGGGVPPPAERWPGGAPPPPARSAPGLTPPPAQRPAPGLTPPPAQRSGPGLGGLPAPQPSSPGGALPPPRKPGVAGGLPAPAPSVPGARPPIQRTQQPGPVPVAPPSRTQLGLGPRAQQAIAQAGQPGAAGRVTLQGAGPPPAAGRAGQVTPPPQSREARGPATALAGPPPAGRSPGAPQPSGLGQAFGQTRGPAGGPAVPDPLASAPRFGASTQVHGSAGQPQRSQMPAQPVVQQRPAPIAQRQAPGSPTQGGLGAPRPAFPAPQGAQPQARQHHSVSQPPPAQPQARQHHSVSQPPPAQPSQPPRNERISQRPGPPRPEGGHQSRTGQMAMRPTPGPMAPYGGGQQGFTPPPPAYGPDASQPMQAMLGATPPPPAGYQPSHPSGPPPAMPSPSGYPPPVAQRGSMAPPAMQSQPAQGFGQPNLPAHFAAPARALPSTPAVGGTIPPDRSSRRASPLALDDPDDLFAPSANEPPPNPLVTYLFVGAPLALGAALVALLAR